MQRLRKLIHAVDSAVKSPTAKQKEAYGRYFHTLSAASVVAAVSVMFTETQPTPYVIARITTLALWGMLLLLVGAILSKGD
jgi:hypothetical protein